MTKVMMILLVNFCILFAEPIKPSACAKIKTITSATGWFAGGCAGAVSFGVSLYGMYALSEEINAQLPFFIFATSNAVISSHYSLYCFKNVYEKMKDIKTK